MRQDNQTLNGASGELQIYVVDWSEETTASSPFKIFLSDIG